MGNNLPKGISLDDLASIGIDEANISLLEAASNPALIVAALAAIQAARTIQGVKTIVDAYRARNTDNQTLDGIINDASIHRKNIIINTDPGIIDLQPTLPNLPDFPDLGIPEFKIPDNTPKPIDLSPGNPDPIDNERNNRKQGKGMRLRPGLFPDETVPPFSPIVPIDGKTGGDGGPPQPPPSNPNPKPDPKPGDDEKKDPKQPRDPEDTKKDPKPNPNSNGNAIIIGVDTKPFHFRPMLKIAQASDVVESIDQTISDQLQFEHFEDNKHKLDINDEDNPFYEGRLVDYHKIISDKPAKASEKLVVKGEGLSAKSVNGGTGFKVPKFKRRITQLPINIHKQNFTKSLPIQHNSLIDTLP